MQRNLTLHLLFYYIIGVFYDYYHRRFWLQPIRVKLNTSFIGVLQMKMIVRY